MHDGRSGVRDATIAVSFTELLAVAQNLRWTWHLDVRALFRSLFPEVTPEDLEWPVRLLEQAGATLVEERLASDHELALLARQVVDDRSDYLDDAPTTWFPTTHRDAPALDVAFLAAEFALTDSLPIFAGGLGAIAGEQLKSASALGVPIVGVGLLYRETPHQRLDAAGAQRETFEVLDPSELPVSRVRGRGGERLKVSVPFPGRDVVAEVWTAPVGRTTLFLLDTDLYENSDRDRKITSRLYGGDLETRIQQELVLGIGGVRALAAHGHRPNMLHLNEGHTAFAALQQIADIERRLLGALRRRTSHRRRPARVHHAHARQRRARLLPARACGPLPRGLCGPARHRARVAAAPRSISPGGPDGHVLPDGARAATCRRPQWRQPVARRGDSPAVGRAVAAAALRRGADRPRHQRCPPPVLDHFGDRRARRRSAR